MTRTVADTKPEDHLTKVPVQEAVLNTYLGMAHIAGTGPEGTTCRQCIFYCSRNGTHHWYSHKRKDGRAGLLKAHYCNRPIVGKAERMFPSGAASCRLSEPSERPAIIGKPAPPKGVK